MRSDLREKIEANLRERAVLDDRPTPAEIRVTRQRTGFTLAGFGALFEPPVTAATVSRWESGERSPNYQHTAQLLELMAEIRDLVA